MRKRDQKGRFVSLPGVGSERVSVELGRSEEQVMSARSRDLKWYTRKRVAQALPDIVSTFVRRAAAGSVPHARALATLGGLDQRESAEQKTEQRRGKTLGRRLLEELDEIKARKLALAERAARKAEEAKTAETTGEEHGEVRQEPS